MVCFLAVTSPCLRLLCTPPHRRMLPPRRRTPPHAAAHRRPPPVLAVGWMLLPCRQYVAVTAFDSV